MALDVSYSLKVGDFQFTNADKGLILVIFTQMSSVLLVPFYCKIKS